MSVFDNSIMASLEQVFPYICDPDGLQQKQTSTGKYIIIISRTAL